LANVELVLRKAKKTKLKFMKTEKLGEEHTRMQKLEEVNAKKVGQNQIITTLMMSYLPCTIIL
jgi:hypothetical protein